MSDPATAPGRDDQRLRLAAARFVAAGWRGLTARRAVPTRRGS